MPPGQRHAVITTKNSIVEGCHILAPETLDLTLRAATLTKNVPGLTNSEHGGTVVFLLDRHFMSLIRPIDIAIVNYTHGRDPPDCIAPANALKQIWDRLPLSLLAVLVAEEVVIVPGADKDFNEEVREQHVLALRFAFGLLRWFSRIGHDERHSETISSPIELIAKMRRIAKNIQAGLEMDMRQAEGEGFVVESRVNVAQVLDSKLQRLNPMPR